MRDHPDRIGTPPAADPAPPASRPVPSPQRTALLLDRDIVTASALLIDGNARSRNVLAAMLMGFGVPTVVQASSAEAARRMLEYRRFDIVLCEYHFEGHALNGQELLDDLRSAQLLPLSTVVVMISGETAYAKIAEVAEAALDAYLIKPHSEQALRDRLVQARLRKRVLKDVIDRVDRGDYLDAARLCQARFQARAPLWIEAARIGAELWLRLGQPKAAQAMFDGILQVRRMPWARLGIARSEYASGSVLQARRTLESLLEDQPAYADAYDVMGRVLLDQGEPDKAVDALRRAVALTPGSVARGVKFGLLAFYFGDAAEARQALERAAAAGAHSKVFDLQGLVLLATLQYDAADLPAVTQSAKGMTLARAPHPGSARLRRFEAVTGIYRALLERRVIDAAAAARHMFGELHAPDFDFEAACNALTMISRLHNHELRLGDIGHQTAVLARRFAVSRTTCDLLRAAAGQPHLQQAIADAYAGIGAEAQRAVAHSVGGAPRDAVLALLAAAEATLNGKLIDLAAQTLAKHAGRIEGAAALQARIDALNEGFRSYGAQARLNRADDPRTLAAAAQGAA